MKNNTIVTLPIGRRLKIRRAFAPKNKNGVRKNWAIPRAAMGDIADQTVNLIRDFHGDFLPFVQGLRLARSELRVTLESQSRTDEVTRASLRLGSEQLSHCDNCITRLVARQVICNEITENW